MLKEDPKRISFLGIDMRSRERRRWLVIITYSVYLGVLLLAIDRGSFRGRNFAEIFGYGFVVYLGIVALSSPLKSLRGEPIPRGGTVLGDRVLFTLDDWARYKYGGALDSIAPKKRQELLRFYSVDKLVSIHIGAFSPGLLERDIAERNSASHRTLQFLVYLICIAAAAAMDAQAALFWDRNAGILLLAIAAVSVTMPKAIILWTHPAPRCCDKSEATE